ncbi:hypothetical protein ASE14_02425 [Agromyces sp. Root81]|uniref:hypothetical protein n=1 Tax=Agromyces sp. Root81 TaxID=1736601 RepID=UPI0006FAEF98|nr:hypothetical protein [Agromyces sp. Root81]KRC62698.1 hypothetical protein ASE14_02425 [Agromyces sp. Root81]
MTTADEPRKLPSWLLTSTTAELLPHLRKLWPDDDDKLRHALNRKVSGETTYLTNDPYEGAEAGLLAVWDAGQIEAWQAPAADTEERRIAFDRWLRNVRAEVAAELARDFQLMSKGGAPEGIDHAKEWTESRASAMREGRDTAGAAPTFAEFLDAIQDPSDPAAG